MIDPQKLVAGTEAVYGTELTHKMYGVIRPIEATRVHAPDDEDWFELSGRRLQVLHTEGHARHHYCLFDPKARGVFTGDNFGVSYREFDTEKGAFVFPTTTPASFDPPEAHKSVDRIMACEPVYAYLTHYSRVGDLERLAADMHKGIDAYVEIAIANKQAGDPAEAIATALFDYVWTELQAHDYRGDEESARSVAAFDLKLNADGLAIWLRREELKQ